MIRMHLAALPQSLPVPAVSQIMGNGAARSGRRTPGPHAWLAAPLPFMRGDGKRGAPMDKQETNDPTWFFNLSSVDRRLAKRIISLVGEGILRRISQAISKGAGRRGAPPKQLPKEWLVAGYRRWLMTTDESSRLIATAIISECPVVATNDQAGRIRALEEKLRAIVKERHNLRRRETGFSWKERHENPDDFDAVESALSECKRIVRIGPERDEQEKQHSLFSRFMQRRVPNHAVIGVGASSMLRDGKVVQSLKPLRHQRDIFQTPEYRDQSRREFLFYDAFDDLIPADLPVTIAQELYFQVREFLEAEASARGTTKKT